MANISMAKGTVGLSGKWTGRALDLLNILLENWSFEGAYGLTVFGKLSEKNRNVEFSGCGRWDFHGTLLSMHDWTVEHIEKREARYGFDITMYGELLKEMKRLGLAITFDFSDIPENDSEYHEIGYFISDGNKLVYKRGKPQEWRKGEKSFDSAVDFFSAMISEPDKNTLAEWVEKTIEPTDKFVSAKRLRKIELVCVNLTGLDDPLPQDIFQDFYKNFLPDTKRWISFREEAGGWGYCLDAFGSMELTGEWTKEDINALKPVLAACAFNGAQGIWSDDGRPLKPARDGFSFRGAGIWKMSDLLKNIDGLLRKWISEPAKGRKNTLEKAEYEKLLEIMKDRGLTIGLSFTDLLEEADENYDWEKGRLVETGYLSSDGEKLVYITETRGIKEN